ncbi:hypothetical protein BJ742DRAFT_568289 [Cladochytrium replicatum]|nr:hypothetical protein BJ742DRAFT_568289 [Cladochytrium replicatum]
MDDGSHSHAQQLQSLTGASENNSQFGGTSDSSAKQDTILLEPSFQFAANQWPPLLQRRDINNQQQQHPQITREGGAESEAANDQMLRPTEPPMFTSTFRPQNSMFQSGQKYSPYRVPRNRRSFLGSYSTSEEKTLSESSFATPASTRRAKRPSPIDTHAPLIWKSSNDSQALKKVEEKDDQSGNADAGSDTQERGRIAGGIRREMERSRLGRLLGQPTSPSTNKSADKPPLPPGFESRSDTSMRESLVGGGPISTTGPVSQGSMLAPSAFGPPSHLTSDGPSAPTTPMSISSDGPGTTGFPFQMVGIGGTTPSSRLSSRRNSDDNGMMMDMTLLSSSFPNQMTESLVNDTRMSRDSSPALSESFGRGIPISRRIPSWSGGGGSSRPAVNPFIRPPPQSSSLSDIFSADTASPSMDTSEGSSTTPKMGSGSESGRNARWNSPMMEDSPTPKRSRQRSLPSLSVNPMSGTRSGRPYPPMTPVRARYAGDDEGRTSRSVLRTPAALRSVSSSDRPQTPMTLRHSQSGIKNRIIRLLQEETHLTEKEFAHEHAAMEYIKLLHDGDANAMRDSENLPESPHSMVSFADELFVRE